MAINGILEDISREKDFRHIIAVQSPREEIEALKDALRRLREENEKLRAAVPVKHPAILQRLGGGQ